MDNNSFHTRQSILLQPEPCLTGLAYPFSLAPASSSSKSPPSLQPHWMVGPSHYHAYVSEGIAYLSEHLADPSHGMDSSDSVEGLMSLVFLSIHAFSHKQHSRDLPQLSSGLWVFGKTCHNLAPSPVYLMGTERTLLMGDSSLFLPLPLFLLLLLATSKQYLFSCWPPFPKLT